MRAVGLLCVVALGCAGCATGAAAPPSPNLLQNGSFEQGREPWFDFQRPEKPYWGSFEISEAQASAGRHSLQLSLDSGNFPTSTGIAGAAQDVATARLPRRLSGRYRVERWEPDTPTQYIQLVVMAFDASNFRQIGASLQLSLILAGIDTPPFAIGNRRFEFAGPRDPELGRWIPFAFDLHEQFARHWGGVPVDLRSVRVFVEARFDGLQRSAGQSAGALVYFDALHLGD
ncbi:MAG: hypothetical protein OEY15_09690 [Myxococcales bacterium]|nr:hypothetical protein [Myxococcales bacterium]